MIATNNSEANGPWKWRRAGRRGRKTRCPGCLLWLVLLAFCAGHTRSVATEGNGGSAASEFALRAYAEARERFQRDTNDVEAAWQFARTCFDWADYSRNDGQRAQTASEGITASRQAIATDPKLAAGHYYLAYNLGQLARTKLLGALAIVKDMERELKTARDLDENFDFAGPDRTLGQLYFDAPGWPTSIGDKARARKHLQRAVQLNGRYPDNRLLLIEAWLDSHEKRNARRDANSFAGLLPDLRREFTGEAWASSWSDWDRRWKVIQDKVEKLR